MVAACFIQCFILPRQVLCQFTDPEGMDALVGLGEKIGPGIWIQVYATAGASSLHYNARQRFDIRCFRTIFVDVIYKKGGKWTPALDLHHNFSQTVLLLRY